MEAVHTHADTVGLLKAVRDQPRAFSSALQKAKEAYAECGRVKSELEKHCKKTDADWPSSPEIVGNNTINNEVDKTLECP